MARKKQNRIVASITDKLGRTIVLEQDRWDYIGKHEQLDGHELAVMRAVENADRRVPGNYDNSELIYGKDLGPARWLAVVVEYDGLHGRVITAYPCNKPKEP